MSYDPDAVQAALRQRARVQLVALQITLREMDLSTMDQLRLSIHTEGLRYLLSATPAPARSTPSAKPAPLRRFAIVGSVFRQATKQALRPDELGTLRGAVGAVRSISEHLGALFRDAFTL